MPLRIGCDLDGTLADLDSAFQREAERLFGTPADTGVSATRQSGRLRALWAHIGTIDNFWRTLQEVEPGAVAQMAAAAHAGRWEILFLTQRPATTGDTTQRQSQQWLEAHGFERPSVFVVSGSRGKIASSLDLDVVLDDRPQNCLDVVADSQAASMLVWRQRPERVPPGIARLRIDVRYSMAEAIDSLQQLDQTADASQGMIHRVRHALRPLWRARRTSASVSHS